MTTLRVMTANVGAGLALTTRIAEAIMLEAPDVIALQELPALQARELGQLLRDRWPHQFFHGDGNEGRGIISRYLLVEKYVLPFATDRPDVLAVVDVAGCHVRLIVAHPRPQEVRRTGLRFSFASRRQILRLIKIAQEMGNTLLVGDLNMSPRHPAYSALADGGFQDAWTATGHTGGGWTFPRRTGYAFQVAGAIARSRLTPVVRFDYIFGSSDLTFTACHVGADTGSDHAPVVAEVIVSSASPAWPASAPDQAVR